MKRFLAICTLLILSLPVFLTTANAQTGGPVCRDAAGRIIPCPPTAVPPTSAPQNPSDRDKDGVIDSADKCPDQAGPASNNGCPFPPTAAPLPIPKNGPCSIATLEGNVNVRFTPSVNAKTVDTASGAKIYPVLHIWKVNGETWYRIASGWVSGKVVRFGGDCANVPTSVFDPSTAGAIPNWGPHGELTFCQPDYAAGEKTCVPPTNANGAVPSWDAKGNLTFCQPDYTSLDSTCYVIPASAIPNWGPHGELTFCQPDYAAGEKTCVVGFIDIDGGLVVGPPVGKSDAPANNPTYHKFLLLGKDGLIVLTAPQESASTMKPFPIRLDVCAGKKEVECAYELHGYLQNKDLPLAACKYNDNKLIQCTSEKFPAGQEAPDLNLMSFVFVPIRSDLPLAACKYDDNKLIQCYHGVDAQIVKPDFPIAGCAYNRDALIQCKNPNDVATTGGKYENGKWVFELSDSSKPTQTREHILLARQVGVPMFELDFKLGKAPNGTALLLPAVQKVREAANR
jgi:hypothetical protein